MTNVLSISISVLIISSQLTHRQTWGASHLQVQIKPYFVVFIFGYNSTPTNTHPTIPSSVFNSLSHYCSNVTVRLCSYFHTQVSLECSLNMFLPSGLFSPQAVETHWLSGESQRVTERAAEGLLVTL